MSQPRAGSSGLVVVHGNRLEDLRDELMSWLTRAPLGPLENEVVLVQSNGIAQWFKLAMARPRGQGGLGISAAVDVQLPGQFLWSMYGAVLGGSLPDTSPLHSSRLVWRLLRVIPAQSSRPGYEVLRRYLSQDHDWRKRYQLAVRVASLFDQYQVHRADWLNDWERGHDVLADAEGRRDQVVPEAQTWQPRLWRAVLADLRQHQAEPAVFEHRGAVHDAFVTALRDAEQAPPGLPRRVVVFGISSLPRQTLQALEAMARFSQVILVVMNPCRHYWADLVEERQLLRTAQRRQQQKPGRPAVIEADSLHLHANPLLAAWGKQGRDFVALLDELDRGDEHRGLPASVQIERFREPDGDHLLAEVQRAILELDPLPSSRAARRPARRGDPSLRFHVAHGPQREVEILHDQLLHAFERAQREGKPLAPRDVIVMVPDIQTYAPHIEAVFGRHAPGSERHLRFTIADQASRGSAPLLVALELLLAVPERRLRVSEVLDLLDVPAVRARFEVDEAGAATLRAWVEGACIRWGLDAEHRSALGFPPWPGAEQNTWLFGLRRMLYGYAVGDGSSWRGIAAYDEVGGLDAQLVGPLAELIDKLGVLCIGLSGERRPAEWAGALRALLGDFFAPADEADSVLLARLDDELESWQQACEEADFDAPLPLMVVRDAWLSAVDAARLSQRFLAGAVSFGTLMPMRAIPFRVVCLLGMNDGEFPRRQTPLDFDLMAQERMPRAGDRSRRDDDRYLFLEALLSAREILHVSWVGRSARDNSELAPSVLVGQLRDYLAAGWQLDAAEGDGGQLLLDELTVQHPLQPFARDYFATDDDQPRALFTYASEWRLAHETTTTVATPPLDAWTPEVAFSATMLRAFLRSPIQFFFNQRLKVYFAGDRKASFDDETFAVSQLDAYSLGRELVRRVLNADPEVGDDDDAALVQAAQVLRESGQLPMGRFADTALASVHEDATTVLEVYRAECRRWGAVQGKLEVSLDFSATAGSGYRVEEWVTDLRGDVNAARARVVWSPNAICSGKSVKLHRLLEHWVVHVLAHAAGVTTSTRWIGPDALVTLPPLPGGGEQARGLLNDWFAAIGEGMRAPLPLATKTALAWLAKRNADDPGAAREAAAKAFGSVDATTAYFVPDAADAYVGRAYPSFAHLLEAGFERWAELYAPLHDMVVVEMHAGDSR